MFRVRATGVCAVLILLMGCISGCVRGDNRVDEEKDPHFQRGRSLASGQDFKRAADEFEKALESNPRSAAAHFELGWLCDTKLNDYAGAIYHYERHLQLRPDSDKAAKVKERIRGCKQELANSEFPLPGGKNLQKDVDRLTAENQALKQQIDALKAQLNGAVAGRPEAVRSTYAAPTPMQPTPAQPAASAHPRTHIVKSRETISSIAAQYGLRASDVLNANPRVDPRRLRVGQSLNLP
jgi:LysM repeat protein